MTTDRREQVLRLYHLALTREGHDRDAFLDEACADDPTLRHQVEALLINEPPDHFLDLPEAGLDVPASGMAAGELIGRQMGPYRLETLLGCGGMGEVYRPIDTALGREVAIKVLPAAFAFDSERRVRLEREARTLATLNHPHIAAIYGLEDADGVPALVLELVAGETLAERLARTKATRRWATSATSERSPCTPTWCSTRSCRGSAGWEATR
jgi:hypothetical protein